MVCFQYCRNLILRRFLTAYVKKSNESSLDGKDESPTVEMTHEYTKPNKKDVHAMLGIAHEFANPTLIQQEEGAFERAMVEKHAADSTHRKPVTVPDNDRLSMRLPNIFYSVSP